MRKISAISFEYPTRHCSRQLGTYVKHWENTHVEGFAQRTTKCSPEDGECKQMQLKQLISSKPLLRTLSNTVETPRKHRQKRSLSPCKNRVSTIRGTRCWRSLAALAKALHLLDNCLGLEMNGVKLVVKSRTPLNGPGRCHEWTLIWDVRYLL